MTQANDSILVTPGSGATVATHLVNGKEYQVTLEADGLGHIKGSRADFLAFFTPATNAVNRRVADLFNADATGVVVRVQGIWVVPTVTAITGANIQFKLSRTSAAGTGGTAITSRPLDTTYAALDADITARAGATGGATVVYDYMFMYQFNEETNAATQLLQYYNLLPVISDKSVEVVLRQNEGVLITQTAGATVGLTGALMYFTVE